MRSDYKETLIKHYSNHWGEMLGEHEWSLGPVHELSINFSILEFKHSENVNVFSTCCMSEHSESSSLEVYLLARKPAESQKKEIIELLTVVAHYHRNSQKLGLNHTVNFGKSWIDNSQCTYGLLSIPYVDDVSLEWCNEKSTRILWLIPITNKEREFKKKNGIEQLEYQFEKNSFNYLDPKRASVV